MIQLKKVDWDNYEDVIKLHVTKKQEFFVADNDESLIHAFLAMSEGEPVFAFAIYNDDTPVGFIQMGYDDDWSGEEREDWLNSDTYKEYEGKPYYYIWRFMIDKKYQGQGFGRESFKQTLDFIKTFPCGKAEYILLSYEPSNELGRKLYGSFGFKEVFKEYLHDDDEVSAMLKI